MATSDRSSRIYRLLLRAYPRAFRDAFARAMASDFDRRMEEARRNGRRAVAILWLRTARDWLVTVPREHLDEWSLGAKEGTMGGWIEDLRMVVRRLARNPGFTVVTVLVLAIGIGANTALFTALRVALFNVPPYPDVGRIVLVDMLWETGDGAPPDTMVWSYPKFEMGRDRITALESLAGYARSTVTLTGVGNATRASVEYVTPDYFSVLGGHAELGRLLDLSEEAPREAPVVVLSHALWTSRFGSDPGVLGRTLVLDGAALEVVGVMDRAFQGLTGPVDLWAPMAAVPAISGPRRLQMGWAHWLQAVGTLRPGVSLADARVDAARAGPAISEVYPDPDGKGRHGVSMVRYLDARVNPVTRNAVGAVTTAAILFLLIGCGNVAGLLLARASARRTEIAVRAALGAGRARLLREHLLEGMVLAGLGGSVGILLALATPGFIASAVRYALDTGGTRGLVYLDPDAIRVGPGFVLAGVSIALVSGLACGLIPAWSAARIGPTTPLREGAAAVIGRRGASGQRTRSALVAMQLAFTLVLLAGARLMGSSFSHLAAVQLGFSHDDVLTLQYDLGPGLSDDEYRSFIDRALAGVRALPGVQSASAATCPPLAGRCEVVGLTQIEGEPPRDPSVPRPVIAYVVTPEYFETIGVPVLEGRGLGSSDGPGDPPDVLVSESAARRLFPGGVALGARIKLTHELTSQQMATVVGVVGDVRYAGLDAEIMPAVYMAERQATMPYGTLFVRGAADPDAFVQGVRDVVTSIVPDAPLYSVSTLAERRSEATARTRIVLGLLLAFALSGLALAALGLYGFVSYSVSLRTREIGLRIALGARRGEVTRSMVVRPVLIVVTGAVFGAIAAWGLAGLLRDLLFDTPARSPSALLAATALLLGVSVASAWTAAARAARVEPIAALRLE